ncbi:hypothetical protein SBOR_4897 [Sclerotinia borealis F-4128]|uniref:Uncharacterized protein n=1 Tax=Sclerotinia borealis (strain F-4128) TaxID=1432307 RepID=W9CFL2_SCLBF|nr:hypothetical protein SBOR_4897 [Sclerotinia borealis F-4128]
MPPHRNNTRFRVSDTNTSDISQTTQHVDDSSETTQIRAHNVTRERIQQCIDILRSRAAGNSSVVNGDVEDNSEKDDRQEQETVSRQVRKEEASRVQTGDKSPHKAVENRSQDEESEDDYTSDGSAGSDIPARFTRTEDLSSRPLTTAELDSSPATSASVTTGDPLTADRLHMQQSTFDAHNMQQGRRVSQPPTSPDMASAASAAPQNSPALSCRSSLASDKTGDFIVVDHSLDHVQSEIPDLNLDDDTPAPPSADKASDKPPTRRPKGRKGRKKQSKRQRFR